MPLAQILLKVTKWLLLCIAWIVYVCIITIDSDDSALIGSIIGLVLGACALVVIIVLTIIVIKYRAVIKKYASRNRSSNEYVESPDVARSFMYFTYS